MNSNQSGDLPTFNENGCLPPGQHPLSNWEELVNRFGHTERRRELLNGLHKALLNLKKAGCQKVYLDGSFITDTLNPNDYDGCWDDEGINTKLLDPILLNGTREGCQQQKKEYGGELLLLKTISINEYPPFGEKRTLMIECYQVDDDGNEKGIILIQLQSMELEL